MLICAFYRFTSGWINTWQYPTRIMWRDRKKYKVALSMHAVSCKQHWLLFSAMLGIVIRSWSQDTRHRPMMTWEVHRPSRVAPIFWVRTRHRDCLELAIILGTYYPGRLFQLARRSAIDTSDMHVSGYLWHWMARLCEIMTPGEKETHDYIIQRKQFVHTHL